MGKKKKPKGRQVTSTESESKQPIVSPKVTRERVHTVDQLIEQKQIAEEKERVLARKRSELNKLPNVINQLRHEIEAAKKELKSLQTHAKTQKQQKTLELRAISSTLNSLGSDGFNETFVGSLEGSHLTTSAILSQIRRLNTLNEEIAKPEDRWFSFARSDIKGPLIAEQATVLKKLKEDITEQIQSSVVALNSINEKEIAEKTKEIQDKKSSLQLREKSLKELANDTELKSIIVEESSAYARQIRQLDTNIGKLPLVHTRPARALVEQFQQSKTEGSKSDSERIALLLRIAALNVSDRMFALREIFANLPAVVRSVSKVNLAERGTLENMIDANDTPEQVEQKLDYLETLALNNNRQIIADVATLFEELQKMVTPNSDLEGLVKLWQSNFQGLLSCTTDFGITDVINSVLPNLQKALTLAISLPELQKDVADLPEEGGLQKAATENLAGAVNALRALDFNGNLFSNGLAAIKRTLNGVKALEELDEASDLAVKLEKLGVLMGTPPLNSTDGSLAQIKGTVAGLSRTKNQKLNLFKAGNLSAAPIEDDVNEVNRAIERLQTIIATREITTEHIRLLEDRIGALPEDEDLRTFAGANLYTATTSLNEQLTIDASDFTDRFNLIIKGLAVVAALEQSDAAQNLAKQIKVLRQTDTLPSDATFSPFKISVNRIIDEELGKLKNDDPDVIRAVTNQNSERCVKAAERVIKAKALNVSLIAVETIPSRVQEAPFLPDLVAAHKAKAIEKFKALSCDDTDTEFGDKDEEIKKQLAVTAALGRDDVISFAKILVQLQTVVEGLSGNKILAQMVKSSNALLQEGLAVIQSDNAESISQISARDIRKLTEAITQLQTAQKASATLPQLQTNLATLPEAEGIRDYATSNLATVTRSLQGLVANTIKKGLVANANNFETVLKAVNASLAHVKQLEDRALTATGLANQQSVLERLVPDLPSSGIAPKLRASVEKLQKDTKASLQSFKTTGVIIEQSEITSAALTCTKLQMVVAIKDTIGRLTPLRQGLAVIANTENLQNSITAALTAAESSLKTLQILPDESADEFAAKVNEIEKQIKIADELSSNESQGLVRQIYLLESVIGKLPDDIILKGTAKKVLEDARKILHGLKDGAKKRGDVETFLKQHANVMNNIGVLSGYLDIYDRVGGIDSNLAALPHEIQVQIQESIKTTDGALQILDINVGQESFQSSLKRINTGFDGIESLIRSEKKKIIDEKIGQIESVLDQNLHPVQLALVARWKSKDYLSAEVRSEELDQTISAVTKTAVKLPRNIAAQKKLFALNLDQQLEAAGTKVDEVLDQISEVIIRGSGKHDDIGKFLEESRLIADEVTSDALEIPQAVLEMRRQELVAFQNAYETLSYNDLIGQSMTLGLFKLEDQATFRAENIRGFVSKRVAEQVAVLENQISLGKGIETNLKVIQTEHSLVALKNKYTILRQQINDYRNSWRYTLATIFTFGAINLFKGRKNLKKLEKEISEKEKQAYDEVISTHGKRNFWKDAKTMQDKNVVLVGLGRDKEEAGQELKKDEEQKRLEDISSFFKPKR